jgi:AcrR family transcriptional regulator
VSRRVITGSIFRCMPRWEEGSRERLQQAAVDLFEEQGFEHTTAVQIAERARVTTRTFFRYFADKQDVLFADEDLLRATLVQKVLEATDIAEPLQAVTRVLAEFNWEGLASRESLRRREAMIASTPYLLERELIKQHQMADELGSALHHQGVDLERARLAAHVGALVFRTAYRQWLEGDDDVDLAAATDTALSSLAAIVPPNDSTRRDTSPAAKEESAEPKLGRPRRKRARGSADSGSKRR